MKCCSSCFCCFSSCIGWIGSNCRCFWYCRNYTFSWPWQFKLYFTFNQRQIKNLQNLLKYFNGTTISVSNILSSSGALPIISVLYSKYLLVVVYSITTSIIIFACIVIHFISIIIRKFSWCHTTIVTIF